MLVPNYMQTWGLARAFGATVREWRFIEDRAAGLSGMPADIRDKLTLRELRDLVAYLATLESAPQPEGH